MSDGGFVDPEQGPPREIIEYFEIPLRRPFFVLVPFFVCALLSVLLFFKGARWYMSSTLILVESESVPTSLLPGNVMDNATAVLRRLKQEVLSRTRLERIAKELDPYPELSGKASTAILVEKMRDTITVSQKGGDAFMIQFEHQNPYLAMAVANRLATLFIEEASHEREQKLEEVHKFLDTQLETARQELEAKELQIRQLKLRNEGALPEQLATNLSTLQRLQLEKQTLSENLRSQDELRASLEARMAEAIKNVAPMPGRVTESQAKASLAQMQGELAALKMRYTEEHPEVRRLSNRIAKLEAEILKQPAPNAPGAPPVFLDPAVAAIRDQLESARLATDKLKQGVQTVSDRIASIERQVERTPGVEAELIALTRDYGKVQSTYSFFMTKKADAELTEKLESQWKGLRFKTLDPAYLPSTPFKPKLIPYLSAGLGIGLLLGLFASVAAEFLDHSIKNTRDLLGAFPYPLVVTIPHIRAGKRAKKTAGEVHA